MSITPIGGAGAALNHISPPAAAPDTAERAGAPDTDSDTDNGGAAAAVKPAALSPGTVNLRA